MYGAMEKPTSKSINMKPSSSSPSDMIESFDIDYLMAKSLADDTNMY